MSAQQMPLIEQEQIFPLYSGDPITRVGDTLITYVTSREILTKATGFIGKNPDQKNSDGFDYTLNPMIGCQFGCQYCYASTMTQSEYEQDNWGYWVRVKENAIYKLAKHRRIDGKSVYMSSVTDPYQPIENKLGIVRSMLDILAKRGDRVLLVIQTRSPLVTRDIDLMEQIIENGGRVQVNMTITTDSDDVRRKVEPGCPSIPARLKAISEVGKSRVDAAITMSPLLYVQDHEQFANQLIDTGATRFIAQSLHPQRNNSTPAFKATTWLKALEPMAEILECSPEKVMQNHNQQYKRNIEKLSQYLPEIQEGRAGFKPPF